MKNRTLKIISALVLGTAAFAFAHDDPQKFTGTVSDSMCGTKHMTKDKTAAECARQCAKDGSYALVVGDKVYTLAGDKAEIGKFAGDKAIVEGGLKGETITVNSIKAEK